MIVHSVGEKLDVLHDEANPVDPRHCFAFWDLYFVPIVAGVIARLLFCGAGRQKRGRVAKCGSRLRPQMPVRSKLLFQSTAGGLMSCSAAPADRQVAVRYVARIIKGAKPFDRRAGIDCSCASARLLQVGSCPLVLFDLTVSGYGG
jgi:hypothetical protein